MDHGAGLVEQLLQEPRALAFHEASQGVAHRAAEETPKGECLDWLKKVPPGAQAGKQGLPAAAQAACEALWRGGHIHSRLISLWA